MTIFALARKLQAASVEWAKENTGYEPWAPTIRNTSGNGDPSEYPFSVSFRIGVHDPQADGRTYTVTIVENHGSIR